MSWLLGLPDRVRAVPVPESLRPILAEASRNLQGLLQSFLETLLRFAQGLLGQGETCLASSPPWWAESSSSSPP